MLPKNEPKIAGERLVELSQQVFLNGIRHGARTELTKRLYPDTYFQKRPKVSGWCRGDFLQTRGPLTPGDFQRIVNLFWQKPNGIQAVDEVFDLARCIGKIKCGKDVCELVDLLDRTWLENLGFVDAERADNLPRPDNRYPRNMKTISRASLLEEIERMIPRSIEAKQSIVIHGQPGTGKTTLVEQITNSKWGDGLGEKRTFFLNGQGISAHLRAWYQDLVGMEPTHGMKNEYLVSVIRNHLSKKKYFILMDDVASVEYVSPIMNALQKTQQFVIIITTRSPRVVREIASHARLRMTMPGLNTQEAKKYFGILLNRELERDEESCFDVLVETLKGNPLGLYFAFQQLQVMEIKELLELLRGVNKVMPQEMLQEVFLPLQVGFELLPDELRNKFIRLASMKRFYSIDNQALAALWADPVQDVSLAETKLILANLQKFISPFQPGPEGESSWKLHEQTHLFAISKFDSLDAKENKISSSWVERLNVVYEYSEPSIQQAFETSKKMGFKSHRPGRTKSNRFQDLKAPFVHAFWSLIANRDRDWEDIQKELAHINSYEYFIGYRLQRDDKKHLGNIRVWLISIALLFAMNALTENYSRLFPPLSFPVILLAWSLYTIRMYRVDWAGYWKSSTRWQLIWSAVSKRISDENQA